MDSSQHLLSWAARRAPDPRAGHVVRELVEGRSAAEVAARHGLPVAAVEGIRAYYEAVEHVPQVCDGTACHFAGGDQLRAHLEGGTRISKVRCLGHCYAAPCFRSGDAVYARPWHAEVDSWIAEWGETGEPAAALSRIPRRSLVDPPAVLRHLMGADRDAPFEDYDLPEAATILARVETARLNGRGGAAFPTARKWIMARDTPAPERYVVANGDEGDPGSYVDRLLLEEDPHAVLAGMVACARVIGSRRGFVFVRCEYPRAEAAVRAAVAAARSAGRLGPAFDVEVLAGAGSYVCGEETALLRSIQGLRGEPTPKPPYPSESGLWGMPTVIQNVETLALVPWIARTGAGGGTKAFSVSGAVTRAGVIEAPLGTRLSRLLEEAGGEPPGRRWKMAVVGGPMGRVLPAAEFDVALSHEELPGLGHGGVVVLDDRVSARELALHLADFARAESCGSCTPCRMGTSQLRFVRTRAAMERLFETLEIGSLCGFGQGVPRPFRDLVRHFEAEIFP